jgi:aromatic ring hydroxylase
MTYAHVVTVRLEQENTCIHSVYTSHEKAYKKCKHFASMYDLEEHEKDECLWISESGDMEVKTRAYKMK